MHAASRAPLNKALAVATHAAATSLMGKLSKASILKEDDLTALTDGVRRLLGEDFDRVAKSHGLDVEGTFRFLSVAEKCRNTREEKGLSVKEAARRLKVPQYRLRDIEGSHVTTIDGTILQSYVELLGLKQWLGRWVRQNRALYAKLSHSAG